MTHPPLHWLKQVEDTLLTMQQIPLWGSPPPFPWEQCSTLIGELLQLPELKIELKKTELRDPHQFLSSLGEAPYDIPLALTPLSGTLHWLMSQADVAKLTQLIVSTQNEIKGFSSPKYQEGFYRYLALNVLQALGEIRPFHNLSITMASAETPPDHPAICIDIAIKHPKLTLWGRLLCPPAFIHAFKAHFSAERPSLHTSALSQEIAVPLRLELGHAVLSLAQWSQVKAGDVVILERCTYDPETHKGTVTITLKETPLFRARLKEHHVKIVDYAYYHEEENTMDEHEDAQNEELPEPLEEETLHEIEASIPEENHLWAGPQPSEKVSEQTLALKEVPLTLTVEVTRLNMNLEKVLQLSVGNLIELPVRPEQGVHLVLNGKRVAQGELVKIGEMLGVKILHIGN